MSGLFCNCNSLLSLPDISIWDTSKVIYINNMFANCSSLLNIPDISRWNTSNVLDMSLLFFGCESLISLPDISNWNIPKVIYIDNLFTNCFSLEYLPKISKWKIISNIKRKKTEENISILPSSYSRLKRDIFYDRFNMIYGCIHLLNGSEVQEFNKLNKLFQ